MRARLVLLLGLVATGAACHHDSAGADTQDLAPPAEAGAGDLATPDADAAGVDLAPIAQQAYIKASNTRADAMFGVVVALSADGSTLAVGAQHESSGAVGVDGNQHDTSMANAGAVYVFVRSGSTWSQQAYLKASNTRANAHFGVTLSLSNDGSTLAVGADSESSGATGINGNQADTSAAIAGAVYVFTRTGTTWSQQAYVKASNTRASAAFGASTALSADGNRLAVGSFGESSNASGVNGDQSDTSFNSAGAAYVFARAGSTWSQEAYVKASNPRGFADFGVRVALSGDGNTLAVGSNFESSNALGIDGNQGDISAPSAGAVYVFRRGGTTWSQEAYVKASNTRLISYFGFSVALVGDGSTMVVGAPAESSKAKGIDGDQADTSAGSSGAAYIFARAGTTWSQQAYVKASNTRAGAQFGVDVAISADGNRVAIGSAGESSGAAGIDGNQDDTSADGAGAAYLFARSGGAWTQRNYVKASNSQASASFGFRAVLSADASTLAVGAMGDSSKAIGINGDQSDSSAVFAGAVYAFR